MSVPAALGTVWASQWDRHASLLLFNLYMFTVGSDNSEKNGAVVAGRGSAAQMHEPASVVDPPCGSPHTAGCPVVS